jgi:integrase/recombinase XerD
MRTPRVPSREEKKGHMIDDFLTWISVEKGYSEKTVREYAYDLHLFERFLGEDILIGEASTTDIRRFLQHLRNDRNYAAVSLHRKICCLRTFFAFLSRESMIESNPCKRIESPKTPKPLPKTLSVEETKNLLRTASSLRDKAILYILYSTGVRVSELCNLDVPDVDLKSHTVTVRFGKGRKDRIVPLAPVAAKTLQDYLTEGEQSRKSGPVFVNDKCTRLTPRTVERVVKKAREKAGITTQVTPHVLRHAFATHLIENQVDIRVIQELLGHASLATTQIYTHISVSHLKDEFRRAHPISSF